MQFKEAASVPAICLGPRRPSFTRGHCDIGFSPGTVPCDPTRPSWPRRPSFTRGHCDIGFSPGTVPCDPTRPSFTSRHCDCCINGTGQEGPASPEDTAISDSVLVLCLAIPRGRASPAGIATAVSTALAKKAQLHQRTLRYRIQSWYCALRSHEAELHQQALRLLYQRHWPRRPSFTRGHCDIGFSPGTVPCDPTRPSWPRRPSFTRGHCDIGFSPGTVPCDPTRPSFTSRHCDCCINGTGQEGPASPEDTAISDSVLVLCLAIPRGRASPAGIATAVTTALAKKALLHQRALRYRIQSWYCALRSHEAELHQQAFSSLIIKFHPTLCRILERRRHVK